MIWRLLYSRSRATWRKPKLQLHWLRRPRPPHVDLAPIRELLSSLELLVPNIPNEQARAHLQAQFRAVQEIVQPAPAPAAPATACPSGG
eukprot:5297122-Pyramimonas_sp.AAC.1